VRHAGILDAFQLPRQEAENLIMTARLKAGWIEPEAEAEAEAEAGEAGEAAAEAADTGAADAGAAG
jgi:N utilization substance protein A